MSYLISFCIILSSCLLFSHLSTSVLSIMAYLLSKHIIPLFYPVSFHRPYKIFFPIIFIIIIFCLWPIYILYLLTCVIMWVDVVSHYVMTHHVISQFIRKQANNLPSGQHDLKPDKSVYSSLRPPNLSKLQCGSTTAEKRMAQLQTAA